jgi:hypothetical protein
VLSVFTEQLQTKGDKCMEKQTGGGEMPVADGRLGSEGGEKTQ